MSNQTNKKYLPEKHKVVVDCIRVGKSNATTMRDIMILTDIKEERNFYQIIEDLINEHGYVIGASKTGIYKGYYIPANDKEFKEIADTFKRTINSMSKRYDNLLNNYNKLGA